MLTSADADARRGRRRAAFGLLCEPVAADSDAWLELARRDRHADASPSRRRRRFPTPTRLRRPPTTATADGHRRAQSDAGLETPPEPRVGPPVTAPPAAAYTYEEFDVPPGTHPHDVAPAPDGTHLVHGAADRPAGHPRSGDRRDDRDPARRGSRAARRDRRARRRGLDHRRRPERDRPRRSARARSPRIPAAAAARLEPQHRRVRRQRHPLVHRSVGRRLRPASIRRQARSRCSTRPKGRPVRHRRDP